MEATTPAYPTRLSETQWATLPAYFAADSQLGRPPNTNLPAVVEAAPTGNRRRTRPRVSPTASRSAEWGRLGW